METSKRKKKGRPSLLDLQKRNLKEQHNTNHKTSPPHSSPNPKSAPTPNPPPRRSTRRNPNSDDEDKNQQLDPKRPREKKLKLVLNLPSSSQLQPDGSCSNAEEDEFAGSEHRKRKINAIGDGSELSGAGKLVNHVSCSKSTSNQQVVQLDSGPFTPLPDKKLLLFILERLQKKDTYSVFSEPVDPEELPDYHEIIEHPMDFSTVKKKLESGAYASLEHYEKDIFLICSNAMQYNSPNTVYFRQARSIQELAKRNFENLRQDSDNDDKPEPKVVRRGRPPTKHLKKPIGRPSFERTGSEFSDATLASGGENSNLGSYDVRRGSILDKSGSAHGSRDGDPNWLTENKFDWNDEFTGSILKGYSKFGNKQFILDENRRHTYNQFHPSAGGREPSVLATFSVERKQLMAVGLQPEQGYARSLARFAANLGPVAWKIASKRIERSLSIGIKFGPGWVGENDLLPHRPLTPPGPPSCQLPSPESLPVPHPVQSKEDKPSEKHEEDNSSLLPTAPNPPSLFTANKSPEPITERSEACLGLQSVNGLDTMNISPNETNSRPPFPIEQGSPIRQGMNGTNSAYGSRSNSKDSNDPGTSKLKPINQFPSSGPETLAHAHPSWQGKSLQPKPESGQSLQPKSDLNIRFRTPSSSRTDSTHPDLALQL